MHASLVAPLGFCEDIRAGLLAVLAGLTPERWEARSSAESWTLAEQVDHLIRAEIGTSKMARRLIRGDFRELTRSSDTLVYDSGLEHYPYGRLPAPAGLLPAAQPPVEATAQLAAVHRRFAEELGRFQGPDADALAAPDPLTGVWFTLGGWVRLQGWHEAHHLLQIRALLAARVEPA